MIDMLPTWRKGTFCLLLTLILSCPLLGQAATQNEYGRYHALVIGNNDYAHLPKLKTAINDATAVAKLFEGKYGFNVTLLLNANRSRILNSINKLRSELTAKDRLLIYYAGHGELDRESGTGYWLPVDAEPENDTNWIANESLSRHLRAMTAHHVLVVADSCYSGALVRAANVSPKSGEERDAWIQRMAKMRSRTAMVSGGLEPVADAGRGGHSVFANAFLNVLGDNDVILDGQALFQRVRSKVVLNADQTPQYSNIRQAAHEGGDFLFVPLGLARKARAKPVVSSADTGRMELTFWNSVKDSDEPAMFGAYLNKYPDGLFAELARLRLQRLKIQQIASLKPAIVLEPIEGTYVAVKNANVRNAPSANAGKVATLRKGSEIYVPGKVAGKNWLAVDQDGNHLGYVFSSLLQDREEFEAARIEEVKKQREAEAKKKEAAALRRRQAAERQAAIEAARIADAKRLREAEAKKKAAALRRRQAAERQAAIEATRIADAKRQREAEAKKKEAVALRRRQAAEKQAAIEATRIADARIKAEASAWDEVAGSDSIEQLRSFLARYARGANAHAATARIDHLLEAQKQQRQRQRQQRQQRQAEVQETAAWAAAAASGGTAAFRNYLRQFPQGANASRARVRLADLEASARKEAPKLAMLTPKSEAKTANPGRFDGNWTASISECGIDVFGEPISYDFELRVTSGKYHIKATAEQRFYGSVDSHELSGPIGVDGRISVALTFRTVFPDDPNLKITLTSGDGQPRISFNNCRLALTAKQN